MNGNVITQITLTISLVLKVNILPRYKTTASAMIVVIKTALLFSFLPKTILICDSQLHI